ncbi:MAG TPA: tetratricopeptide repeat protein [Pyrinomonadaceae bacterium]|jgi:tetratricopeptide (TPR) repeat protein
MSSVYFNQFEHLWKRIEDKFHGESDDPFTLDNLRNHLISRNLLTSQTDLKPIEKKFLQYGGQTKKPQNVNLSDTIFNALFRYLDIRGISDLSENVNHEKNVYDLLADVVKDMDNKIPPKHNFREIEFLGREKELSELENFLLSSANRIFALYGVPMIGKTKLVNHFLENNEFAKTYKVITVKLNPNPDNVEQRIKDEVFGDKDFNDFSGFSSNTLIIIQNFEEALKWTGNFRELHDIKDEYANVKTFLEKAAEISSIKLILESRFQIHFELFLTDWRTKVKTLSDVQLEGIEKDEFWQFYKSKGFSYEQFEKLCENFGNHTGLLALAYNDAEFLFQNRLIEAYYQPTLTTRFLWDLVEHIINRLEKHEAWILCALTFLQRPIKKENLYDDFLTLPDFEDELQIDDSYNSLANKLLVQVEKGFYDLNPYIREVCYTFLKVKRRIQMQTIKNLPYFKEHGKTPYYNEIHQAQERGDYMFLFDLGRRLRKEGNCSKAIEAFEAGLTIDPKRENVLNEIGITYKWQKNWKKAIETLENAIKDYPDNVKILNELGICYRENRQLDKAIGTLEKASENNPNDVKTLDELGICYRENHQIDKAIKILEKAKEINPNNLQTLNELAICYRENRDYENSIKIAEKSINLGNYQSYTVLAKTYQKMGDIETAYQIAEEGMKTSGWDKSRLIRKFQELKGLLYQLKQHEKEMKKLKVFLSYAHKDEDIKVELDNHLSALKRSDKISTWNDRELRAGAEWDNTIKAELENADIVLLLISANFIASNYIWNIEIKKAIEKHENGTAVVIPIFCKFCDFGDMPFAKLQGLPKDAKFIASQSDKDQTYTEVAIGIRKVVENLLK